MVLLPSVAFQLIDPDLKAYSPRLTKHRIIISSLDYIKILIILCGICAALLIIKITNIRMPEQCVHYSLFIIYPSESQKHFKKTSSSYGFVCVGACTHIFVQPNVCVCCCQVRVHFYCTFSNNMSWPKCFRNKTKDNKVNKTDNRWVRINPV